ncbi:MAG: glycosyltransferase N-terminal domain-containing protein [Bacteroidaceae bacterium]|nr:glycosyltransferase N-terminal domain-containing protein [Bacteroidaceae bacterium]
MMYSLAIFLYMLAVIVVSPFHKKAGAIVRGHIDTFKILREKIDRNARYVWFHAASLGEFEQGRPLIERFRREHPEYKILLTFFSPSGYEVRKNYEGADVICYLPFDTPGNVMSFFRLVRPEMAFFIKYEFWWNFLRACKHYNIPVYSISSIFRANKVFFKWYGKGYSAVLRLVDHFFVQDEESARLLSTLHITDNVTIVGDTRFDRVLDIQAKSRELPLVETFGKDAKSIFVAGSSWPQDEELIIPYFNNHPQMKLILAPHVIDEAHLKHIESKLKRPFVRYTEADEATVAQADCLIINCFGLLSSIYRYGNLAYVGGGFGAGIHNVPEAAVYGIPVLFGPNNKGFREAQDLLRMGGCFEITGQPLFNALVDKLTGNPRLCAKKGALCRDYIKSNAGATDTIFSTLQLDV